MELTPSQTQFIRADLKRKGLQFQPLQEDLLDHACCLVEEEMSDSSEFKKAYSTALKKLGSLNAIQSETLQAVQSVGMLPKFYKFLDYLVTAFYLALGLLFFAAPILLALYHRDSVFVLFFSPFVIAGFWLLATRINYRSFAIVTFRKTVFPGSLVR